MSGFLKVLAPLFEPVGMAWFALLLAAAICSRRRRWLGATVLLATALGLWAIAQPPLVAPLMGELERPWLQSTVDQAPAADAVIVLGGGWRESPHEFAGFDLTAAADRLMTGIELCQRGRAAALVLGGDPPISAGGSSPDTEQVRRWLERWGLAKVPFHTLGPVINTRDEAVSARELIQRQKWKRVLLVTSAFHMRRALAVFAKEGVAVHPVACDFQAERLPAASLSWKPFPDAEAIAVLDLWWHEQVGWLAYRLLGKI